MRYSYVARTKEGKRQRGTIETSSRKTALFMLEKYGLYVTFLKELKGRGFSAKKILFRKIPFKEVLAFTRQFSVMLKSAIPPVEALKAQVAQTENSEFREKILKMAELVEGGESLSRAFDLFPGIFSPFFVNVVKSGEATGKLADSLTYLADHLEREYTLRQKLRSAMIYPGFIIFVFIATFFLATFFIIPRLTEILKDFGTQLPWTTKIMISLSNFVQGGGWIFILGIFSIFFLLPFYFRRNSSSRGFYDKLALKVPVMSSLLKKVYLTKFSENLSVLIASGLPITQALKIVEEIMENSVYKSIVKEAEQKVSKGEKISSVFFQYPKRIPLFVSQMIATGEQTGRMEETLEEVAKFYRKEIERTTANLAATIEPFLIIVLGLAVAVFAISVLTPLFKIGIGGMGI